MAIVDDLVARPGLYLGIDAEPGVFELGAEGSPFPMKVELSMPEPGRLRHVWWYGRPGEAAIERDVALLTRIG